MIIQNTISSMSGNATITLPAVSDQYYILQQVIGSYSSNISIGAGTISITFGSTKIFETDLSNPNFQYDVQTQSDVNQSVTITLKGITLLTAKLNIGYDVYTV